MTPRAAAAVLLWRQAPKRRDALEIYFVRRGERVLFLPGFWSFPGGRVEPRDGAPTDLSANSNGPDAADERGQDEATQLRRAAACARRELFEETGVWTYACAPARDERVQRRRLSMRGTLATPTTSADDAPVLPLATFTTPHFTGPRFRAHYFACALPQGEAPEVWPGELAEGRWLTPADALALHAQALLLLAPPVLATLEALEAAGGPAAARLGAAAEALTAGEPRRRFATRMAPRVTLAPVRSPTLPPSTHTNCYLLGERDVCVVDPGCPYPDEQAKLVGHLNLLCAQGARVREIWLTHHHPDHTGGADAVRVRFGAKILAHPETSRLLEDTLAIDGRIVDNQPLVVDDDVYLALHTPGHAPGHLCFYDRRRGHLLSGDNVLGLGTSIVMPRPHGDMRAYIDGLERLLTLKLGLLLPGHGPPAALSENRVAETLRQRYAREQMLVDLLAEQQGPVAVAELVSKLYRGTGPEVRSLAALSCLSHVEKLVEDGRARLDGPATLAAQVELMRPGV